MYCLCCLSWSAHSSYFLPNCTDKFQHHITSTHSSTLTVDEGATVSHIASSTWQSRSSQQHFTYHLRGKYDSFRINQKIKEWNWGSYLAWLNLQAKCLKICTKWAMTKANFTWPLSHRETVTHFKPCSNITFDCPAGKQWPLLTGISWNTVSHTLTAPRRLLQDWRWSVEGLVQGGPENSMHSVSGKQLRTQLVW